MRVNAAAQEVARLEPTPGPAGTARTPERAKSDPYRVTNSTPPVPGAAIALAYGSRSAFTPNPFSAPAAAASAARCERLPVSKCAGATAIHLYAPYWVRTQ
jgi:hypothetical protein